MKFALGKIKKSNLLILFVSVVVLFLLYQYRIYLGNAIWQLRNINNYTITVQTQEEFGAQGKVKTTCLYILAVQKEEIELADVSCENNVKQKLTYLGQDLTATGLINLAKDFQSDDDLKLSINWQYGFPNKLEHKENDDYHVIITVENFRAY